MHDLATVLQDTGRALHTAARQHKRAERANRRTAQQLMQRLDELDKRCREIGIELDVQTQGGQNDE